MIGVVYDPATATGGRCAVIQSFSGNWTDDGPLRLLETEIYDRSYSRTHCVDVSGANPVLMPCAAMTAAWDAAAKTLSGLPVPCMIRVHSDLHQIADGEADLSDLAPDTYDIDVWAVGYLNRTYTVTL